MLPGGILHNGELLRSYEFDPITGNIEMQISETWRHEDRSFTAISEVLGISLDSIGGVSATAALCDELCIEDRQFLIRELVKKLGHHGGWFTQSCVDCNKPFNFNLLYADLPVEMAGSKFPYISVQYNTNVYRFRIPNGKDLQLISSMSEEEAKLALLDLCRVSPFPGGNRDVLEDQGFVSLVEEAMQEVAPKLTESINASCPLCGNDNRIKLDFGKYFELADEGLLKQIHIIASHYHWTEKEILSLPRDRRTAYLGMIDKPSSLD